MLTIKYNWDIKIFELNIIPQHFLYVSDRYITSYHMNIFNLFTHF